MLGYRFAFHELIQFLQILLSIEGNAETFSTITSGTTCFLIIAFKRLRNVIMDDKTHIGLVNTHTEGNGSHDNLDTLHQKIVLSLRAEGRLQSCMISSCPNIVGPEDLCEFLHFLTGETVDNTTLTRMLLNELDNILVHIFGLGTNLIIQVGTVKRALELVSIHDTQVFLDIRAHLVRSRSRQGYHGSIAYLINDGTNTTILRTEIVSPL